MSYALTAALMTGYSDQGTFPRRTCVTVPHPGEVVAEYMELQGWTKRQFAMHMKRPLEVIIGICSGNVPITMEIAVLLEKTFQRPVSFWMNLQRQYDVSKK